MKNEAIAEPLEEQALNEELTRFGTSLLQIRSMTENFTPGKMDQFNHHIEFLSPDGKWFMRMTRVGKVEREPDRINIEIPTGCFHTVLKEEDGTELIEKHQIESGDMIFEVFPYDPSLSDYWYRSVTAHGDDDNPNPPFQPLEKIYNLTKILNLSTPKEAEKSVFDGLEGTYVGFSPTDASDLGMGEIEVTITNVSVRIRMATGMEIQEEGGRISQLGVLEMSPDEVRELFKNPISMEGVRAFKCGEEPWLVFTKDSEDGASVRMFLGIPDLLGPTILFSPNQVSRGLFEKAVHEVEQEHGQSGIVPRLSNNGQALVK